MKVSILALLAFVMGVLSAISPQKAFIVTYPEDTPDSTIDLAMKAIQEAGGMITHEYQLIKGFAAKAPAKVFDKVQAMVSEHHATVEEDQIVKIPGSE